MDRGRGTYICMYVNIRYLYMDVSKLHMHVIKYLIVHTVISSSNSGLLGFYLV